MSKLYYNIKPKKSQAPSALNQGLFFTFLLAWKNFFKKTQKSWQSALDKQKMCVIIPLATDESAPTDVREYDAFPA